MVYSRVQPIRYDEWCDRCHTTTLEIALHTIPCRSHPLMRLHTYKSLQRWRCRGHGCCLGTCEFPRVCRWRGVVAHLALEDSVGCRLSHAQCMAHGQRCLCQRLSCTWRCLQRIQVWPHYGHARRVPRAAELPTHVRPPHNHQSSRLGTPSRCRRPAVFWRPSTYVNLHAFPLPYLARRWSREASHNHGTTVARPLCFCYLAQPTTFVSTCWPHLDLHSQPTVCRQSCDP